MNRRRAAVVAIALVSGLGVATTAQVATSARYPAPRATGFPGGPYFVVACSSTHRSNDDPIVFPRQPGKSHNHTFVGNRDADAFSTPASLRENPNAARCGPRTDASAYWFPTLYDAGRNPVRPLTSIIYYVRRTGTVRPFPPGLKMIAGDPNARRAQPASVASWTCEPPDGTTRVYATVPSCAGTRLLHMNVNFPDCWDGRRLDSADHRSHMAYAAGGRCPASHPVAVPMMRMMILYAAVGPGAQLSSGRYSEHGDFINAWDQDAFEQLVRRMNN
jgi:hypothetical protein